VKPRIEVIEIVDDTVAEKPFTIVEKETEILPPGVINIDIEAKELQ
jgi:hypothetical protein